MTVALNVADVTVAFGGLRALADGAAAGLDVQALCQLHQAR